MALGITLSEDFGTIQLMPADNLLAALDRGQGLRHHRDRAHHPERGPLLLWCSGCRKRLLVVDAIFLAIGPSSLSSSPDPYPRRRGGR